MVNEEKHHCGIVLLYVRLCLYGLNRLSTFNGKLAGLSIISVSPRWPLVLATGWLRLLQKVYIPSLAYDTIASQKLIYYRDIPYFRGRKSLCPMDIYCGFWERKGIRLLFAIKGSCKKLAIKAWLERLKKSCRAIMPGSQQLAEVHCTVLIHVLRH